MNRDPTDYLAPYRLFGAREYEPVTYVKIAHQDRHSNSSIWHGTQET